jgi:hypothetical protein
MQMVYSETHDMLLSAVANLPPVVLPDHVIMQQAAKGESDIGF